MISLHETCEQYVARRLSEGWRIIHQQRFNVILQSPDGILRPVDLRNDISGPNSPGTMEDDATVGTVAWINSNNAKVSDNTYATAPNLSSSADITENSIKIIKEGVIQGNEKSTGATIPTTEAYISYGALNDLWGLGWSADNINSANFGVVFSAVGLNATSHYLKATNFGFSIPIGATINGILVEIEQKQGKPGVPPAYQPYVDHIRITVDYTAAKKPTFRLDPKPRTRARFYPSLKLG